MREKCKCYEEAYQPRRIPTIAMIELQKVNKLSIRMSVACLHLLYFQNL